MEGSVPLWQAASLLGLAGWVLASPRMGVTRKLRSLVQPWVTRRVRADTPLILWVQSFQHWFLDAFFSLLSCVVSVPFYTGFLPLIFWSGHSKLARQMTLLIAFCDYFGNSIKDLVSAPRPSTPPVRRVTSTKDEEEHAMEYGLPSSHALNTVCMVGYMLYYVLSDNAEIDHTARIVGYYLVLLTVFLVSIARIYLGMHSMIDVLAGIFLGFASLAFWISIHEYVEDFIVYGKNVSSFWAALSFFLCFAYPSPQHPTPSFDYHAAFNGVAFGIISGVQQTYNQFHHQGVPRLFVDLPFPAFLIRVAVGIPTILIVKFCSKALSKWLLPVACNTLSIPITSSSYVPSLGDYNGNKTNPSIKPPSSGYFQKIVAVIPQESFDVDTGIRFFQYAGLAWSVVDLVPSLFAHLRV